MAKKASGKKLQQLVAAIRAFVAKQGRHTFNYRQVASAIEARASQYGDVAMILEELAAEGEIAEITPGKYKYIERNNIVTGTFVRRSNGRNSVITDDDGESISVAERNSMHALNGDIVKVCVAARRQGQEPEGEVIKILEKKNQVFIGRLQVEKHFAYLLTDSKFLACDIFIPRDKLKGGKDNDKVVVKITGWPEGAKNPKGEVVKVLGKAGENDTEIHAILAEFGLPYSYPENLEKQANGITGVVTKEDLSQRIDMRKVTTFTIDPRDAKDFDDALSIRRLKNGNLEIGVHIADVTHYVKPGTPIDKEAFTEQPRYILSTGWSPCFPRTCVTKFAR